MGLIGQMKISCQVRSCSRLGVDVKKVHWGIRGALGVRVSEGLSGCRITEITMYCTACMYMTCMHFIYAYNIKAKIYTCTFIYIYMHIMYMCN